ncbi:MAG: winged helix-turn-helix transcriptional regulator [Candidatus Edwardsbacteria bacterium]|nr:winged helix-turn-helix transcriptional regulator [Candidatus Edwardsbacteria bacterium]
MKNDQYKKFKDLKDQYDAKRRAIIKDANPQSKASQKLSRDFRIFERWIRKQPGYMPSYNANSNDNHIRIPKAVLETKKLNAADKLVYGYFYKLGTHMPFVTVTCTTISKRLGISLRTVHRCLENLEKGEYITIIRYSKGEQLFQGRENVYICEPPMPDNAEEAMDAIMKLHEDQSE